MVFGVRLQIELAGMKNGIRFQMLIMKQLISIGILMVN